MSNKIVICGGGAAGIMAAITAAEGEAEVTVLEAAEKPLKKLLMTGNGRCNISNTLFNDLSYMSDDPERMNRIVQRFGREFISSFFRKTGLKLKSRNGWLYPYSDSAASVAELLFLRAIHSGVKIKTNEILQDIEQKEGRFIVHTQTWHYDADAVIIACGSPAHVQDDHSMSVTDICDKYSIEYKPFRPVLVPLIADLQLNSSWAGVRTQARGALYEGERILYEETGQYQLTDYGISGIPAFQISRFAAPRLEKGKELWLEIDFLPDMSVEDVREFASDQYDLDPRKKTHELFYGLLPKKLIMALSDKSEDMDRLITNIKNFRIRITGTKGFDDAQVCSGGVLLDELGKGMQSVKVPGLYFAGENINVDGACGGYNLHWAWVSGFIAGSAASGSNVI